jgi:hypothetical protein
MRVSMAGEREQAKEFKAISTDIRQVKQGRWGASKD